MTPEEAKASDLMELFALKWGPQLPQTERGAFLADMKALMEAMTRAGMAIATEVHMDALRQFGMKT